MKKLPTVNIAVCAYNEERNIKKFLFSVLLQKQLGYQLKKVILISDGSDDNTVKLAKSVKHPKLKIVAFKKRTGKSFRLNQLYHRFSQSDILVQSDADVVFESEYTVSELIRSIIDSKKVGMSGGNPIPFPAKTFTEKAVNCTFEAYLPLRKRIRGGNNIFSADGRLLAYRKKFYQA